MCKIEELIMQLCPEGVEHKRIKDVFKRIKGTPITASKMKEIQSENGEIRVFAGGRTVVSAKEIDIPNANITRVPAVLVQSRGVIDVVYFEKPFTFKNEMWAYSHEEKTTVKYLYYYLKNNIQSFRDSASGMGSLPQISLPTTEDFQIPIPPLAIQEEIVSILDTFTKLEAELEAELEARKKQYTFYRDSLLSFEGNDVEWKTLGDVVKIHRGKRLTKSELFENEKYPVYHGGLDPLGFYNKSNRSADTVMVINVGASAGTVGYSKVDFWSSDGCYCIGHSELLLPRFIYYSLLCQESTLRSKVRVAGIPTLDAPVIERIQIPIPSIKIQERIVSILDKFDSLVNDISMGLPAEIKSRRRQYEYYRNQLLTFNSVSNE